MPLGISSRNRLLAKSRQERFTYHEEQAMMREATNPVEKAQHYLHAQASRLYSRSFKKQAKQANDEE